MSPLPPKIKAVAYTARRTVALIDFAPEDAPLKPGEIAGRTLTTLVSPGTEINGSFDVDRVEPLVGGYAAVFEVTAVGADVVDIVPGQRVLSMGPHTAWQRSMRSDVVLVPAGLSAVRAVFARLMAVSWATLTTTNARPPDRVLVTGLGIIGNLAAQIFGAAGYRVTACDPLESRRLLAAGVGLTDLCKALEGRIDPTPAPMLAVECSGHEQAAVDCCRSIAKGGEVVLVGVPWKKRTDLAAFELLHAVFHRYVHLRSGWEWELPYHASDFRQGNTLENLAGAMDWILSDRVLVDPLQCTVSPTEAQRIYDSLYRQEGDFLSAVFDWRQ
jgi:threonine dehydrogenase-like Zn-dependent dehydrogenase